MDRNREPRRASSIVGSNGFNKRRHRTNSLRDSPDEDGGIEMQESARLRDRVKKDRDRERERERERDRERERERERDLRERSSRTNKRRRANNREDIGGDETTDESFNEDDDDEEEEHATAATGVRFPPPPTAASNHHHQHHSFSTSYSQQQHNSSSGNIMSSNNSHLQHRKSFPMSSSSAKVLRAPPVWKSGDETISASVPRKARSACTKRLHDWISSSSNNNSGGGGEQNLGQVSDSPARQTPVSTSPPPIPAAAAPMSPSSSNASARKKLKPSVSNTGPKLKPPLKVSSSSSKPSSSNPEELEIEIAEVLYGLMTQSQGPSSKKEDSREVNNPISVPNSAPLSVVAPKRKRPRQIPDNSIYGSRSISVKPESDQTLKKEISSPNLEKISGSGGEIGYNEVGGNSVISQAQTVEPPVQSALELTKLDLELKPASEELRENRDLVAKEEMTSPKEKESSVVRTEDSSSNLDLQSTLIKENLSTSQMDNRKEGKFEIDLMAPPPQSKSSPERELKIDSKALAVDPKPIFSIGDAPLVQKDKEDEKCLAAEEKRSTVLGGEEESQKAIDNKGRNIDLHLDLEKSERDSCAVVNETVHKSQPQIQKQHHQQQIPFKATKDEPLTDKSGHLTSSLPLPMSVASWPPMGYMAPLQGVVSMDGAAVTPAHMQPLFTQPRPKRCATHCHIARNIHCLQQFMKMNPFWPGPAAPGSLFGSKPCNLNIIPAQDLTLKGGNSGNLDSKAQSPNHSGKEKNSQPTITSDSSQRKQQQILIQQPLPPSVAPPNLMGPTFIFPLNQQHQQAARPTTAKSPSGGASTSSAGTSATSASAAAPPMSFNYPNMAAAANETQYLAILQNNGYPFPVGAPPNYRGGAAMPLFNGSFYSPQMIHPQQLLQQQAHHQNTNTSSNSLSAQKQQNPPSNKNPPPQQLLPQLNNQYVNTSRPRQFEGEENNNNNSNNNNSPSNNDGSRGYRPPMNIYGQNFTMMHHPQNFAMMTNHPTAGNQNEKKGHQGSKGSGGGVESLPPQHSFAMSFGPINGGSSGGDMMMTSSMAAHNHAMMAAAQVAHKNGNKSGSADSSVVRDDERKGLAGKSLGGGGGSSGGGGQSIAFTRADSSSVSSIQANNNASSTSGHNVGPMTAVQNANIQAQFQQQQQMMMQIKQQQQQLQLSASRGNHKAPPSNNNNNNNIYSDQSNSSSSTKYPNAQNLAQSNNGGAQSPQWRSSTRTQPSSSLAPPQPTTTLKNLPQQQQSRSSQPQMMHHTQISFSGGNQKPPSATPPGGPPPPSSPMMGGSPTTSSVSKGGPGGSPRTTSSASTSNKMGQGVSSSFSTQPANQRSPSILGNPNVASSAAKTQMPKTMQQQAQMFFSNMYSSQSQSPHSSGNSSAPYYTQRTRQHQQSQLAQGASVGQTATSASSGGANTNDPAMAIAAATKGGGGGLQPPQGVMHALLPAGFSYVHPVPAAAVQMKPSEQKQPASGSDNLHTWQPEKK